MIDLASMVRFGLASAAQALALAPPAQANGTTGRVSVGSGGAQGDSDSSFSAQPALSTDGRVVAFGSDATNLVSGDTNFWSDVFVHVRQP